MDSRGERKCQRRENESEQIEPGKILRSTCKGQEKKYKPWMT